MGATIEIKYFNSFILKKVSDGGDNPIWNGSFGIPSSLNGSYPNTVIGSPDENDYVLEY